DSDATPIYQWQRDGADIMTNGTGSTYMAVEADEGHALQVVITSHDTDGTGTFTTSNATSAVTDITPALTAATIAGSAKEGDVLTISGGQPNDSDATLTYQWQRDGADITINGTGSTYTAVQADETHALPTLRSSDLTDGTGTFTTSNATSAVTDITPALSAATIASSAQEGDLLTISGGTPNDSDATLTYQW